LADLDPEAIVIEEHRDKALAQGIRIHPHRRS
jgi:hypothetical protein